MPGPDWREHQLTDVIEAQIVLFAHLLGALDRLGIVPRDLFTQVLRETAERASPRGTVERDTLRGGVRSCVLAFADLLDESESKEGRSAWEPKVVDGSQEKTWTNGHVDGRDAGQGNGRTEVPGLSGSPVWRPRFVSDDEPEGA